MTFVRRMLICGLAGLVVLAGAAATTRALAAHRGLPANGLIGFVRGISETSLYVVRPDGTHVRRLVGPGEVGVGEFAWSPDGRRIAFLWSRHEMLSDLYVVRADGSGVRLVVRHAEDQAFEGLAWSPNGKWITFVSYNGVDSALMAVRTDGSGLRRVIDGANPWYTWSPDGRTIAYVDWDSKTVGIVNAAGGGKRLIVTSLGVPFSQHQDTVTVSDWSPDGRRLLLAAYSKNDPGGTYVYDFRTGKLRVLKRQSSDGCWSPDGKKILVGGTNGIYLINPDGSGTRRLRGPVDSLSWSPDGTKILVSDGGVVSVMNRTGGGIHLVIKGGDYNTDALGDVRPVWQPLPRK